MTYSDDDFNLALTNHYTALIALHHSKEAFTHAYALRRLSDLALTPEHRQQLEAVVISLGELYQVIDGQHADAREALDFMLQEIGLEASG